MQGEGKKRETTGLVECSWCDAVFLTEEMLARHLLLHHLQWNTNCAVCGDQLNNSVMRSVLRLRPRFWAHRSVFRIRIEIPFYILRLIFGFKRFTTSTKQGIFY